MKTEETLYAFLLGKQGSKEICTMLMLGDRGSTYELADRKIDLPLISFREVATATQNFSDSAILGRGGFGTVYKVRKLELVVSVVNCNWISNFSDSRFFNLFREHWEIRTLQ